MRPRPADYLQPGERILLQQRRHPLSVLDELLAIALVWGAVAAGAAWLLGWSGLLLSRLAVAATWAGLTLASVGLAWLMAYRLLRMLTSLYTVTDQRVYEAHGRLWFHLLQTTYDRITDLHVRQSPFGRLWGFGTVTLRAAGTSLPLTGIRAPLQVKRMVEQARSAFLAHLVALSAPAPVPHAAPSSAAVAPAAPAPPAGLRSVPRPGEDRLVWDGRPAAAWLVTSLLGALPFLLVGLFMLAARARAGDWTWLPGGLLVLVGAATAARRVIQFRTTRFEVRGHGLVVTTGWLGRSRVETTYEKVTDIATHQDLVGRIFGFGTIKVSTAGGTGSAVVFSGLPDPEGVKRLIGQSRAERLGGA